MSLRKRTLRIILAALVLAAGTLILMCLDRGDAPAHAVPSLGADSFVVIDAEVFNYANPLKEPTLSESLAATLTQGGGADSQPSPAPEAQPEAALTPEASPTAAPSVTVAPSPTPAVDELPDDDGSIHQDFVAEAYTEGLRIGTVTGSAVYYREEPVSGRKLGSLTKGSPVIVLALKDGWYKVNVRGTVAYMSADYVSSAESGEGKLGYGRVTGSVVNVRDRSAIAGKVLTKLSENEYVTITGISNGWYKIKHGSVEGYMHGDYIEPVNAIPTVKPEPTKAPASSGTPSVGTTVTFGSSPYKALDNEYAAEIQKILDLAHAQCGVPYVWGGTTPKGFDCGGLLYYVFRTLGYSDFPRTRQYTAGTKVTYKQLVPGDLVYFSDNGAGAGHVGMYVGKGMFIHAPCPGKVVKYDTLASGYYYNHFLYGARIIGDV